MRIRGTLQYPEPGYSGCRLVGRCPFEKAELPPAAGANEPISPDHSVRCWRVAAGEIPLLSEVAAMQIRYINPVGSGALDAYFEEQLSGLCRA